MKALMLVCALFTAEAAKLQGYVIQQPGSTDTSSATSSVGSSSLPNNQIFPNSQQQFDIRSQQSFTSPKEHQSPEIPNYVNSAVSGQSQPSFTSPGQHPTPEIPNYMYINSAVPGQSQQSSTSPGQHPSPEITNYAKSVASGQSHQSLTKPEQHQSPEIPNYINSAVSSQPPQNTHVFGSAVNGVDGVQQVENDSLGSDGNETAEGCPDGEVRHYDGSCITPEITRNIFIYETPETEPTATSPPVDVPLPRVEHNIVFIQTQDQGAGTEPIIVPPPQKKHVIYVLNKNSVEPQKVIEIPAPELKQPEVYFVNYADGETPTLPNGIDFETALNSAVHAQGQVIGGDGGPITSNHGNDQGSDLAATSEVVNGITGNANAGLNSSEYYLNKGNPNLGNGGNGNNAAGTKESQRFSTTSNSQFSSNTNSVHAQSSVTNYQISGFSRGPQGGSNSATFPGTNSNTIAQSSGNGNQIPLGFGRTSPQQLYVFP